LLPNGTQGNCNNQVVGGSALAFNKRKVLKISLLSILLLCLLAAVLTFSEHGFIYVYRKDKERQVYEEKIRQLKEANQKLMEEIDKLHNDPDYIEQTARKELDMVRDGEVIYKFADKENNKGSKQTAQTQGKN
jgi:cell division protein DivIC